MPFFLRSRVSRPARTLLMLSIILLPSVNVGAQSVKASHTFKVDPKNQSDTVIWERPRNIPETGTIQRFKKLFKTVHGPGNKVKFLRTEGMSEIRYDSAKGAYYSKSNKTQGLIPGKEVIGWHPHWMRDAYKYYPYHLLSSIAFFAYDINPESGVYNDSDAISQWRTTPMIDSVKQHQAKVLLTLTSYGEVRNHKFLRNESAWLALSDSVRSLLRMRNADGIDLDFNGILPSLKDHFAEFVSFMRNKLGDTTTIVLEIPYDDVNEAYDFRKLKPLVNTFVIQGFDRDNRKCGNKPVPLTPLMQGAGSCAGVAKSVEACIQLGVAPENLVVSIPLYGARWRFEDFQWSFIEYIPYEDIRARYGINNEQFIEELSGSAMVRVGEGADHDVIWYEGQGSLDRKFQWIKDNDLGGAGLWGLGYDGSHPEIWNTVKAGFGASEWQKTQPIGYDNGKAYSLMYSMQKYRKTIGVAVFIIICFFIAGLLLSCLDWRVRDAFFHNNSYRAMLAGAIIIASVLAVYLLSDHHSQSGDISFSVFCYGVLVGGAIVYIASSVYLYYRKRLH